MQDYSALKDVIAICRDAEQGFRGAANAVRTPILRELFEEYSVQRAEFAHQLVDAAREHGLEVPDPPGVAGLMHAGWMELKSMVTGHDEHKVLEETAKGEELSLKTYRQCLAMTISDDLRKVLEDQLSRIERAHERICELRDSTLRQTGEQRTRQAH